MPGFLRPGGGRVEVLKAQISVSTGLPMETIEKISVTAIERVARLGRPIRPRAVVSAAYNVMVEMGHETEAKAFLKHMEQIAEDRRLGQTKILINKCSYCGTENEASADRCVSCGAPLDKSSISSKIV